MYDRMGGAYFNHVAIRVLHCGRTQAVSPPQCVHADSEQPTHHTLEVGTSGAHVYMPHCHEQLGIGIRAHTRIRVARGGNSGCACRDSRVVFSVCEANMPRAMYTIKSKILVLYQYMT